mmetsp:Transcript_9207/g.28645  ORF Transcript_9207/g.28645 Transcript_9207/m.28645 type:complete len:293 (+) Transcript_9207:2196-3074(+)
MRHRGTELHGNMHERVVLDALAQGHHAREEQRDARQNPRAARAQRLAHVCYLPCGGGLKVGGVRLAQHAKHGGELPFVGALVLAALEHCIHLRPRARVGRDALAARGHLPRAGEEVVAVHVEQVARVRGPHRCRIVHNDHHAVVCQHHIGALCAPRRAIVHRDDAPLEEHAARVQDARHLLGVRARAHGVHAQLVNLRRLVQKVGRAGPQLGPHAHEGQVVQRRGLHAKHAARLRARLLACANAVAAAAIIIVAIIIAIRNAASLGANPTAICLGRARVLSAAHSRLRVARR